MSKTAAASEIYPYWSDSGSISSSPKLERDIDVDVVVVGGGITGLTTAYLLLAGGKSVALLERARCGQIDTGHTSAHLTMVTDVRLSDLASRFGKPHAQAAWDAGLAAIGQIDAIVQAHDIECDFAWVDGYLHAPGGTQSRRDLDALRDDASLAVDLGFDATFGDAVPFAGAPGVRFENQARFHPRKYLAGLVEAIRAKGGEIYEHSNADEFSDDPIGVKSNHHLARCRDIVIATHNPLVGLANMASATLFQTKLALYTSYVIAAKVARGRVPDALFWDTADPYHYIRLGSQHDGEIVIVGGEDHKTGQTTDTNSCFERLEEFLAGMLPDAAVTHRWSGQVIETPDGLPYIGRMTDHQYAATGFSGNGLTFGTVAAIMIADAIQGIRNPWADLFEPGRAAVRRGLWEYLKENVDYPYYMVRDRFAGPEGRSLRAVKRGEGKIIERGGSKVAAYRDLKGATILRSPICTHMGCLVGFNPAERTWDCPCHGSRFKPNGEGIAGPAETPLPPVE